MCLHEIEAIGWRVEAERGAVLRVSGGAHVGYRPTTHADQRQATDHRAHLMVEEGTRLGMDGDAVAFAFDIEAVEGF